MTLADLEAILARIQRTFRLVTDVTGAGFDMSYQVSGTDFTTHLHTIGVKAPEQLEDDFLNLFVWIWSLKDYLKAALEASGHSGSLVEQEVNRCPALTYVADIANRAKHGTLQKSRSGDFAKLVDVGYEAPQDAIEKITVAGPDVTIHVKDPQMIRIHATVITNKGAKLDALPVLQAAMHCWESSIITQITSSTFYRFRTSETVKVR